MKLFRTLYCFECKKLLQKKLVWIMIPLLAVTISFSCCTEFIGDYYVDGVFVDTNRRMYATDKAYHEALNGRAIDQTLLQETIAAYRRIPEQTEKHYSLTEEYQNHARPYSAIFQFIHGTTDMQSEEVRLAWQPSEEDLYAQRQAFLTALMEGRALSAGERQFWQDREARIAKPLVYEANDGYDKLLSLFQTVGVMVMLLVSIALPGVFDDEHSRKTDQIILACPLGRTKLYWAKLSAGVSFSVAGAILMGAVATLTILCLYGLSGFQAPFQLMYTRNSDPITCGQAILIAYGCMGAAAAVVGVFVMVLSECAHSNVAALAVSAGMLILSMIGSVPERYRVLAQIWDWLPWCFLAPWNTFGSYTLPLFGGYLTPWQAAPVLYLAAGVAMAFVGKAKYNRCQIGGR